MTGNAMPHLMRGAAMVVVLLGGCATTGKTYPSPQAAMSAVAEVAGTGNRQDIDTIFGAGAAEILWSGDAVADRADGLVVRQMILDELTLVEDGDEAVALVGREQWPFPIPLVKAGDGWRFDLAAGEQEVLNRRVGRNELATIATLHEYVDAQREYAATGRDGNPPAFAKRIQSSPGMHDGLYWVAAEGEVVSPLGPLAARAAARGYGASEEGPQPFQGYYFRILAAQGPHAPGGARSYVNETGLMTGGFAAVAWPASWGNSGVMTFVVSHVGVVFQKDLGRDTGEVSVTITAFDPDETWQPAGD